MNLVKILRHQLQTRKAIADLNAMPNYLLADLGIERCDIPDMVKGLMAEKAASKAIPANRVVAKAGNIAVHSA